ncbi:hypothetical protein [Estrella lausannensis]|uniref:Uncharacterized protein n=1 Tax=Estrella lausannensis TaxID=483423 RepID=A0A0H5DP26_9BACT|nr:hypothetical protein [Estrella lausannensis]CRX38092.1 hypothetical protein ELAC_0740 [Estrella lausannensis]
MKFWILRLFRYNFKNIGKKKLLVDEVSLNRIDAALNLAGIHVTLFYQGSTHCEAKQLFYQFMLLMERNVGDISLGMDFAGYPFCAV